jgi:hypothetical protein
MKFKLFFWGSMLFVGCLVTLAFLAVLEFIARGGAM